MKKVAVQCRNCGNMKYIQVKSGFTNFKIPRQCDNSNNVKQLFIVISDSIDFIS